MANFKDEFIVNRRLLSSYYVAILISFFLFQPGTDLIYKWSTWVISAIQTFGGYVVDGNGPTWVILLFVCFAVTFCIKKFVVDKLGMSIDDKGGEPAELVVGTILIFGMYIYMLNTLFIRQPMPTEWLPDFIVFLMGGARNSFVNTGLTQAEANTWAILPWFWYIGPIAYLNLFAKPSGS
jgi:hypothetical protein